MWNRFCALCLRTLAFGWHDKKGRLYITSGSLSHRQLLLTLNNNCVPIPSTCQPPFFVLCLHRHHFQHHFQAYEWLSLKTFSKCMLWCDMICGQMCCNWWQCGSFFVERGALASYDITEKAVCTRLRACCHTDSWSWHTTIIVCQSPPHFKLVRIVLSLSSFISLRSISNFDTAIFFDDAWFEVKWYALKCA